MNRSFADFEVENGEVLYALGGIKNVGLQAMEHVVQVRREGGPFTDIFDFVERVDPRQVNKRTFETLARAGAFDAIHPNRAQLFEPPPRIAGGLRPERWRPDRASGVRRRWTCSAATSPARHRSPPAPDRPGANPWTPSRAAR